MEILKGVLKGTEASDGCSSMVYIKSCFGLWYINTANNFSLNLANTLICVPIFFYFLRKMEIGFHFPKLSLRDISKVSV